MKVNFGDGYKEGKIAAAIEKIILQYKGDMHKVSEHLNREGIEVDGETIHIGITGINISDIAGADKHTMFAKHPAIIEFFVSQWANKIREDEDVSPFELVSMMLDGFCELVRHKEITDLPGFADIISKHQTSELEKKYKPGNN